MEIFVAVVIVLLVLIYFMVVMLRSVVAEASRRVNDYFLKNLQDYDGRFKERIDTMNKMHEEHEELTRELRSMRGEMISYKTSPFYAPRPLARDVYIPTARYIDNDFFEEYKVAKDKLASIDKQQVIDNVIEKAAFEGDLSLYHTVEGILSKLNFDAMYDLCSIPKEEQMQILRECLEPKEQKFLFGYIEEMEELEEFDILAFVDHLKKLKLENDPHIFVNVGVNEEDYTDPERNIICSIDDNICEGLKIVYQNKIYDYSIYKSRRKVGS